MNQDEVIKSLIDKVNSLEKEIEEIKSINLIKNELIKSARSVEAPKPVVTKVVEAPKPETTNAKQDTNLESKIGKYFMGAVASVLIFISVVLFAKILYPLIADEIKVVLVYALGAALSIVGVIKMHKDSKYKVLFAALAGCGAGILYISNLLIRFLFEYVGDSGLAILTFLWLVGMIALASFKDKMFAYICNAGLIVATIMAVYNWYEYPVGYLLYLIMIFILYMIMRSKDKSDYVFFIQAPVVLAICSILYESESICIISMLILAAVYIASVYMYQDKNNMRKIGLLFEIMTIFGIFVCVIVSPKTIVLFSKKTVKNDIATMFYLTIVAGVMIFNYVKSYKSNKTAFVVWTILAAILSIIPYAALFYFDKIGFLPMAIFFVVLYAVTESESSKYISAAYLLWSLWDRVYINDNGLMYTYICIFVIICFICAMVYRYKNFINKLLGSILLMIGVGVVFDRLTVDYNVSLVYGVYAIISVLMNIKYFSINPVTKEYERYTHIFASICNAIMVFATLNCLFAVETDVASSTAVFILFGLAVCSVNIRNLFKLNIDNKILSIYVCLKYSLYVLAILLRFDAISFVISIVGIALAILFIAVGFYVKNKSFRLYGLVLTLICVFKLIAVDIDYNASTLRPLGFLIAGVLCFGISWLYTRLEKMLTE